MLLPKISRIIQLSIEREIGSPLVFLTETQIKSKISDKKWSRVFMEFTYMNRERGQQTRYL